MIQRIQSIYLVLTILLSFLFLTGSDFKFIDNAGSVTKLAFSGTVRESAGTGLEIIGKTIPFSLVIILIPLIALITVFMFRKRKTQLKFALAGVIFAVILVVLSAYYIYSISTSYSTRILLGFKMSVPIFILIFNILAYRGIRKDIDLIKSYDRLR